MTHVEKALALAAAAAVFVTWLTLAPSIARTIRSRWLARQIRRETQP